MNNPVLPKKYIVILGASFDTGNLGVNALACSAITIAKKQWPDARIALLGAGRQPGVANINIFDRHEVVPTWPVRYCANMMARNHVFHLGLAVFLCRFLPFLGKHLGKNNSTLGELLRCDLVCDITGGDSFSDIYGLGRFMRGYLLKRVCQLTGKPFILLPQTYGPFKTPLARALARNILNHAETIYSRDHEGLSVVENLIGKTSKLKLCPDVAFVMNASRPDSEQAAHLEQFKAQGGRLIGLNISGLLYNGGYTGNNMFGLTCDYPAVIKEIISYFAGQGGYHVLLVPHVLPAADYSVEDDLAASREVLKAMPAEVQERVIVLERGYDQNETKYFVGLCDFFLGARMHATIAALSQAVPAVGMAYSKKFAGVFETAGVADCILDLRQLNDAQIISGIKQLFARKEELRTGLKKTIPVMQERILNMFG